MNQTNKIIRKNCSERRKMDKAELLKVLDMSEDEQLATLPKYVWPKPWRHRGGSYSGCEKCRKDLGSGSYLRREMHYGECTVPPRIIGSLADLAFRLRDEAVEKDWCGWQIGSYHVWEATHESEYNPGKFGNRAKPIHWIIAALIAKGE